MSSFSSATSIVLFKSHIFITLFYVSLVVMCTNKLNLQNFITETVSVPKSVSTKQYFHLNKPNLILIVLPILTSKTISLASILQRYQFDSTKLKPNYKV